MDNLPAYYSRMSPAHIRFEPEEGRKVVPDVAFIDEEAIGAQYLIHRYTLINNESNIGVYSFVSPKSQARIGKFLRVGIYVTWTVQWKAQKGKKLIVNDIAIGFTSRFMREMARMMGIERIWGEHAVMETKGLAAILESLMTEANA